MIINIINLFYISSVFLTRPCESRVKGGVFYDYPLEIEISLEFRTQGLAHVLSRHFLRLLKPDFALLVLINHTPIFIQTQRS